ncbi:uncharacterized protein LOC135689940 [Rhopilema esculentum]|uniref:uncharacterized protein LOC135689940 n=1 Tax=Rhopilema esculentum TaxID=499914 RepID=UPI0031E338B9
MYARSKILFAVAVIAFLIIDDISGKCSSYQEVAACKSILDGIQGSDSKECDIAENCLKRLSCCCSPDMPLQERLRCSVTRRNIGYDIFRLNYICKRLVVQQPASPTC